LVRARVPVIIAGLLLAVATLALAQRPRFGGFEALRPAERPNPNIPYDGRFTFVRINYTTMPGGYWYRGQPAWSHGYPTAERNLMRILQALTSLPLHVEEVNSLSLEDPAIFKYPLLYIIEVGWWDMTDREAVNLRDYLNKGGFVIVDDFKVPGGIGGRGWDQFAENMQRVLPEARFVDLDASHPIFHQFFDIDSLDIVPQAYNAGRPIFRGLYENNDPARPLQMVVNYNTDISQFWEWSERGLRSIAETNEAYKLGVNAILYGLMH
jgi:hypothetical protein